MYLNNSAVAKPGGREGAKH